MCILKLLPFLGVWGVASAFQGVWAMASAFCFFGFLLRTT